MRTTTLPANTTCHPVYEFTNKRWRCCIENHHPIPPGATVNLAYSAVPVLMDGQTPAAVVGSPVRLYYQDSSGQKYNKEIKSNITKTAKGTPLATALNAASGKADYLLVTHPQNLFNQYFFNGVDSLLSHMAKLAIYKQGVLGFLQKNDAKHLRSLIKPGGLWAGQMSPQFSKPLGGYLLLVGETEILPSWTVSVGSYSIRISDAPYSDVSGDDIPDLIVGRIIGDRLSVLSKSIQTSTGVHKGAGGYNFDRDTGVTLSDPGVGPFKKTVQTASCTMQNNGWKTVRQIHPQDEFIVSVFLRSLESGDRIASGDVIGDKRVEIIHAKTKDDKVYILDYKGQLLSSFNCVFDGNDDLAVGNVTGNGKEEIIVADAGSDRVRVYSFNGTLLQNINLTFDSGDAITTADALGLGKDQIVHADDSKSYIDVVQVAQSGTITGKSFPCVFDQHDLLAAGDVMGDSKDEIIVADISLGKISIRRLDTNSWSSYQHKYPLENRDRLAVGNVVGTSQHISLFYDQILVLDKSGQRIYLHRWENNNWVWSGKVPAYLNGNDAVTTGDVGDFESTIKEEIIIANGDSITVYDTDRNWIRRTQRKIKTDFKNTDLIYYQGHASSRAWGSILDAYHIPGNPEAMFGVGSQSATHGPLPRPQKQPKTIFEIKVPDWNIQRKLYQDLDFVEIPGGHVMLEAGKPWVPVLTKEFDYPKGQRVQDVFLVKKSGMIREREINPAFSPPVLERSVWEPVPGPGDMAGRFPERDFSWKIVENIDGSSTLLLTIYPCSYSPEAQEMYLYSEFTFEVPVIKNHCFINRIAVESDPIEHGAPVSIDVDIVNSERPIDVELSLALCKYPSEGRPVDPQSRHLLAIGDFYSFTGQLETGGTGPGYYIVTAIIRDRDGNLLHRQSELVRLGQTDGRIDRLTVGEDLVVNGEPVNYAMHFTNTGTVPLSGSVIFVVKDKNGHRVYRSIREMDFLQPGDSAGFDGVWDTSDTGPGMYQMVCYAKYDSKTCTAERAEIVLN